MKAREALTEASRAFDQMMVRVRLIRIASEDVELALSR
jgi:hypothetical protein